MVNPIAILKPILMLLLCLFVTTSQASTLDSEVSYLIHGIRGFWQGYIQGLYNMNNASLAEDCLNSDTVSRLKRTIDFYEHPDLYKGFNSFGDVFAIAFNVG